MRISIYISGDDVACCADLTVHVRHSNSSHCPHSQISSAIKGQTSTASAVTHDLSHKIADTAADATLHVEATVDLRRRDCADHLSSSNADESGDAKIAEVVHPSLKSHAPIDSAIEGEPYETALKLPDQPGDTPFTGSRETCEQPWGVQNTDLESIVDAMLSIRRRVENLPDSWSMENRKRKLQKDVGDITDWLPPPLD